MIDFRYHLVSLAAVLIALSIGIVLGAGPLNDNIGSTLSGEVTKLRQEKEALRAEGNDQRREIEGRDAYDEATLTDVVGGTLADQQVTVVSLPEAPDEDVSSVRETLELAGAEIGDTVEVTEQWAAPGDQDTRERTRLGAAALRDLGVQPAVPDGAQSIDQVLAVVLSGRSGPDGTSVSVAERRSAWTQLRDGGLLDGSDDPPAASDLVVVLGGPVPSEAAGQASSVDRAAERTAGAWVALTHLLGTHTEGAVLGAAEAQDGTGDASPLTMARTQGSLAEGVSTVDVPSAPMGRAAMVLALVQQRAGASGHYGLGQSADAALPARK